MRIENWFPVPGNDGVCLRGDVYGHPEHSDGSSVRTSQVKLFDLLEEKAVTVSGSRYSLGNVHPEYEKTYPGAKRRLLEAYQAKMVEILRQK